MPIGHVFDLSLVAKARRHRLKLRQSDLARLAGVSREWIGDFEAGKPTLEIGKVLHVLRLMGIEIGATYGGDPPQWAEPYIAAAANHERRMRNNGAPRDKVTRRSSRPPPADWFGQKPPSPKA